MKKIFKRLTTFALVAVMTCSMCVTAYADDDSSSGSDFTGNVMEGTADKNYTISSDSTYTDVSSVKLTWNVPVVTYTAYTTKTWNTSTLRWVTGSDEDTSNTAVSFTLANRGSYAVKANAKFTPVITDSASVAFTGNDVTIDSIVDSSTHALKNEEGTSAEDYITANCTKTISGTVTPVWSKLTAANDTKTKLGTYTITINNPVNIN